VKKIGLVSVVEGALSAAVIGFAGPAQAGGIDPSFSGHGDGNGYTYGNGGGFGFNRGGFNYGYGSDSNNPWLDKLYPQVKVPNVDTRVRN